MESEILRNITNGSLMPQFSGKPVSICGTIAKLDNSGMCFELKTTDNVMVQCNMRRPLSDMLSGNVEVHGVVQGKTIFCDEVIQFADETVPLQANAYNKLCTYLHTVNDLWKLG